MEKTENAASLHRLNTEVGESAIQHPAPRWLRWQGDPLPAAGNGGHARYRELQVAGLRPGQVQGQENSAPLFPQIRWVEGQVGEGPEQRCDEPQELLSVQRSRRGSAEGEPIRQIASRLIQGPCFQHIQ